MVLFVNRWVSANYSGEILVCEMIYIISILMIGNMHIAVVDLPPRTAMRYS